jgi:membrane-bound serine protease (ClpP class)
MTKARLILAIVSTSLEEVALWIIWRYGLPELGIELPLAVLIVAMAAWFVFSVVMFFFVTKTLRKQGVVGLPTMVGSKGKVKSPLAPEGFVSIKSELWGARSNEGNINKGEEVTVVGQDGLMLVVSRIGGDKSKR